MLNIYNHNKFYETYDNYKQLSKNIEELIIKCIKDNISSMTIIEDKIDNKQFFTEIQDYYKKIQAFDELYNNTLKLYYDKRDKNIQAKYKMTQDSLYDIVQKNIELLNNKIQEYRDIIQQQNIFSTYNSNNENIIKFLQTENIKC